MKISTFHDHGTRLNQHPNYSISESHLVSESPLRCLSAKVGRKDTGICSTSVTFQLLLSLVIQSCSASSSEKWSRKIHLSKSYDKDEIKKEKVLLSIVNSLQMLLLQNDDDDDDDKNDKSVRKRKTRTSPIQKFREIF